MSLKIKIYNQKAEEVGEMSLVPEVFAVKLNEALIYQAVVTQQANERQVLAHTKDRGEVRGGGRKPWRQKGTGRARAGSIRSPIWIGGGVTFGPRKERNFKKKINKKMKQKAILMVLSERVATKNLVVLDKMVMEEFKTKKFNEILRNIEEKIWQNPKTEIDSNKAQSQEERKRSKIKRSILVINNQKDDKVKYSGRNLVGIKIINLDNINIVDLLKYRNLILTKAGVEKLMKRYKKL
jgi:large subunit ribosomal protein L4